MLIFFFFNDTATTEIYTLSLHDALPICRGSTLVSRRCGRTPRRPASRRPPPRASTFPSPVLHRATGGRRRAALSVRSEEHTSELQSPCNLVCRLLLEKTKNKRKELETDH